MKQLNKKLFSFLLIFSLVSNIMPVSAQAKNDANENFLFDDRYSITGTEYQLAPGIVEYETVTNNSSGTDQNIDYFCEVDPNEASAMIMGGFPDYDASKWKMEDIVEQAEDAQQVFNKLGNNYRVVAVINADFYNMATGEPQGALVMEGKVYHNTNGRGYFGITKDGKAVVRNGNVSLDDMEMAVGGAEILIKDGVVSVAADNGGGYMDLSITRTAVGVKEDGTVVTMVCHGNNYPVSGGYTFYEVAKMLQSRGCTSAIMLDGSGSSQYASIHEGEEKMVLRNSPSDGMARQVSSSILLVTKEKSDGEFDHAAIIPNNEIYTPGHTIEFNAVGADHSGAPAQLPENGEWRLASQSADKGEIDSKTGVFVANASARGEVYVEYVVDNFVEGTGVITLTEPDNIYFSSDKASVGLGETTDLGLVVKSSNRVLKYKDGDLIWKISDDALGRIENNLLIANPTEGKTGTITATSAYNSEISATITVEIGKEPILIMDFENFESDGDIIPAETYWSIGKAGENAKLQTLNYDRGGKESANLVMRADGDPVRFGDYSLQLNYDFSNNGNGPTGTEGACIGFSEEFKIPNNATHMGIWVYTPEDTSNLWFRMQYTSNGRTTQLDFTEQPAKAEDGIGGLAKYAGGGWHYFETSFAGIARPITIPAGVFARVMYVPGLGMGTKLADGSIIPVQDCVGSIYLDNLMVIFGSNPVDTNAPELSFASVNGTQMEDGMEINSNHITINAAFTDEQNLFEMGVDTDKLYVYVDGVRMEQTTTSSVGEKGGMVECRDILLANGRHTIKIVATDKYGNEKMAEYPIVVNDADCSAITVTTSKVNSALLGQEAKIDFSIADFTVVDEVEIGIKLDKNYRNVCTLTPTEGFEVTENPTYDIIHKILSFKLKNTGNTSGNGVFASLNVEIPTTLGSGSYFTYEVKKGEITYADDYQGKNIGSFGSEEYRIVVEAPYSIKSDTFIVGMENQFFTITNSKTNEAMEGIDLYTDNTLVGTSDSDGRVPYKATNSGKITLVAQDKSGGKSFAYYAICCDAEGTSDGAPDFIHFGSANKTENTKVLTWVSNPLTHTTACRLKISESETMENSIFYDAETKILTFGGDFKAVQANTVKVPNLENGKTYYYQVGCEDQWTAVDSLKTTISANETQILIYGDIQEYEDKESSAILNHLKDEPFDVLLQIGDIVDAGNRYDHWKDIMKSLGTTNGMDNLCVVGNHEVEGDFEALNALGLYGIENHRNSVTYGDVYIGTIPYRGSLEEYTADLEWLAEDTQKSSATWKLWAIHQSPYYTNPVGGNEIVHELVPQYAQSADVDLVLSGHDHSYARTKPMVDGIVNQDQGITYIVTGAVGNKRYTPFNNEEFNFDYFYNIPDDKAIYTTINVIKGAINTLDVAAYEYDITTDTSTQIDQFKLSEECNHKFYYDGAQMKCSICGTVKPMDNITGFVEKEDGTKYYFYNGQYKVGWFTVGEEIIHAGEDGKIHKTRTYSTATCREDGYLMAECLECDVSDYKGGLKRYTGHTWDENHICTVCGWKGIDIASLNGRVDYNEIAYKGSAYRPFIWIYGEDGQLLKAGSTYSDFIPYYENNTNVGTASVHIEGYGDYYGERDMSFEIRPCDVEKFTSVEKTEEGLLLKWEASKAAENYLIYCADKTSKWPIWIETSDTQYLISNEEIDYASAVVYKLRPYTMVDGKRYYSMDYSQEITLCPGHNYQRTKDAPPTCTSLGETIDTCTICGDKIVKTIPALGHLFSSEFTIDKPATYYEEGSMSKHCSRCDAKNEITAIPKLNYGGGGGSITSPTPKPEPPKTEGGETKVDVSVKPIIKGETATATIKIETVDKALEAAVEAAKKSDTKPTVEIKVEAPSKATEVKATLPTESFQRLKENDVTLNLSTPVGDIALPAEVLEEISKAAGGKDVTVSVKSVKAENLSEQQKATLGENAENATIIDLSMMSDGNSLSVLGGTAKISVPYTPRADEKMENLVAWFLADDGTISPCEGKFNAKSGKFDFETTHFSAYVVTEFPFKDIPQSAWYYGGAAYCYTNKLMGGTSETTFAPNVVTSRAMLATVLYRMSGEIPVNYAMAFTDVPADVYYTEAIRWAASQKIVGGYTQQIFAPNDNLTREQMVTMLWRYAGSPDMSDYQGLSKYSDLNNVSPWALNAMKWANKNGIVGGTSDTTLSPNGTATRAQFAVIMQRFMNK